MAATMKDETTYLVLDLEMCGVPKASKTPKYPYKHEIIQIGAVLLNEDYAEISRFSTYVQPQYGYIDWFIEDLTGIRHSHVKNAPILAEALQMLLGWLNGRKPVIYTWSDNDYRQLSKEIKAKDILLMDFPAFMDAANWKDYQMIFGERFELHRHVGLQEAMDLFDIELEGRAHDGLEDAHNTGRLIAKLEKDPQLQLPEDYQEARKDIVNRLSFSLGSLFSGLELDLPA